MGMGNFALNETSTHENDIFTLVFIFFSFHFLPTRSANNRNKHHPYSIAMAAAGQLNVIDSPSHGSRSVDCFEKLEQIGEGTYGYILFLNFTFTFFFNFI